jgi:GH15 family glucan-1,4-alpha-glucosidase
MPDATRTPAPSAPRVTAEPGWDAPGEPRYRPIESYGLIGDMRTAALVGRDGAIDWFCPGRFDAPSLFAAILDADIGGSFRVAPAQPCSSKHLYLPETAILLTRFHSDGGVAEVTDFMPVGAEPCALVRRVDIVRGAVDFRMSCRPGFDYARRLHRVTLPGRRVARFTADDGSATELSSRLPLAIDGAAATARFQLQAGESAWFVLHPAGAADA